MYTAFIKKNLSEIELEGGTKLSVYAVGTDDYNVQLIPSNIVKYCTVDGVDIIRYDTYNKRIAAMMVLDDGYICNKEDDLPDDIMAQSLRYTWGEGDEQQVGNYDAWVEAGSPECSTTRPAQIFGAGELVEMTAEEAKTILGIQEA